MLCSWPRSPHGDPTPNRTELLLRCKFGAKSALGVRRLPATIASNRTRLLNLVVGAPRYLRHSRVHPLSEPLDRGLRAAFAVRNAQRIEPDFDDPKRADHHRGVDVAHVGDAECLAGQVADPDAEHDSALLVSVL